jgi:hypothetical protein
MLTYPLYHLPNFSLLVQEVNEIIDLVGFEKNQIICQSLEPQAEDWHCGIGSIEELEEKEEKRYCYLNSKLENSILGELIKKHNGFRTRIMLMPPRQCYSIHADPTPRLHIPIVTNDQCWMVWPQHNTCKQLQSNLVHWTDTRKAHTFVNGGTENRIHIVMCVSN